MTLGKAIAPGLASVVPDMQGGNDMQLVGILTWWLLITMIGFITIPITIKAFPNLPDRGLGFAKPLGLLLTGLFSWLVGFISFSNLTISLALVLLAGLSYWILRQHQDQIFSWIKAHLGLILVYELFFLFLFLGFLFFRMYNPEIIGTEKFMDMAFLNALTRAPVMPPYDPWLAGHHFYISYYYFGYLLMALMVKLSGIAPAVGFNLSLSLLYALSGLAVFGLLYNLTRKLRYAAGGWAFIYLMGNLDGFKQVLATKSIANFNWWTPSRVIPDTINEFPFFSYLLGDMHPHMLAVPFIMIALGLALNHLKSEDHDIQPKTAGQWSRLGLWGLVLGSLGFINSWDMPSLFFMAVLAFFFQQYRRRQTMAAMPWKAMGLSLGTMLLVAVVPYLPFYMHFHSQAKGLALTTQNTRISEVLLIFGPMLYVVLSFLGLRYRRWFLAVITPPTQTASSSPVRKIAYCSDCGAKLREGKLICGNCGHQAVLPVAPGENSMFSRPWEQMPAWCKSIFLFILQPLAYWKQQKPKGPMAVVLGGLAFILAMMALKALTYGHGSTPAFPWVMGLSLVAVLAVGLLLGTRIEAVETVFVYTMLLTAFLLLFGCEFLHINDTFNPPLDRMNTVFKFYYLTWFLLGLSAVVGFQWAMTHAFKHQQVKLGWAAPLVLLILAASVYSYAGTMIKTNGFGNLPTLDGSAFLKQSYAPDRAAVQWLRHHARGNPVVLEATGGEYTDYARVSTFTGLPTVLGWGGHELQWRGNYDEPGKRIPDIETIYSTYDQAQAQRLLDHYHVTYVFVGTLEKQKYATAALDKFGHFMQTVYDRDGVKIYQRR